MAQLCDKMRRLRFLDIYGVATGTRKVTQKIGISHRGEISTCGENLLAFLFGHCVSAIAFLLHLGRLKAF